MAQCVFFLLTLYISTSKSFAVIDAKTERAVEVDDGSTSVSGDGRFAVERRRTVGPVSKRGSCKCQCRSRYHTDQWHCCKCGWTEDACFPGNAKVTLENWKTIDMKDIKIGDRVATVSNDGNMMFTEVRTFLQKETHESSKYLQLKTENGKHIDISQSHLIFTSAYGNSSLDIRFAEEVQTGDYIFEIDGTGLPIPVKVVQIIPRILEGVYVPLTSDGTLLVNGFYVSCYGAFSHNIAHAALTPLRWMPWLFGDSSREGIQPYVKILKYIGHFLLPDYYKSPKHRSFRGLGELQKIKNPHKTIMGNETTIMYPYLYIRQTL